MSRSILLAILFALPAFSAPATASAQEALQAALISREDSTRLVRAARSDQAEFERLRRNRLPESWGGGSSRCDERVGRFCLTHGRGRDDWQAPPEEQEVVDARLALIDGLGRVAELIPGDGWIAGQRVRYLIEAGDLDRALEAAEACVSETSWCAALRGFVHHRAARPVAADSAFEIALATMAEDERKRWLDITQILDTRSLREYRRMDEQGKADFERRFWRLADPLLMQPGNELWAEHLTRHVWDQLQYRAQSTDGIPWGYDLREILIRYGWPSGWERARSWGMSLAAGPPSLISHYGGAPQDLLPPWETLLGADDGPGTWDVEDPTSRTNYNVQLPDSVARWFTPLAHQVAVFRRPGQAVVVAAYDLPRDSVPEDAAVSAGLALLPLDEIDAAPDLVLEPEAGLTDALRLTAPVRPVMMSLEVMVPGINRLARARYGLELVPLTPGLIAISDLLLIEPADSLPADLDGAVAQARGSANVAAGEPVGLFWEVYGVDPSTTPEITLSLRLLEGRTGWLRRLAQRAGLLREVAPIRLRWTERVTAGDQMPRSLSIQVPEVSPGSYTLEITIEAPGREPLSVRKDLEVIG